MVDRSRRVRLAQSAADVVAMYAEDLPCEIWPELDILEAWDGSALVVTGANQVALADILLELCNYYDCKAEGVDPTSEGEPPRFCRAASLGLGTASSRVRALNLGEVRNGR